MKRPGFAGRWWDTISMDCLAHEFESPVLDCRHPRLAASNHWYPDSNARNERGRCTVSIARNSHGPGNASSGYSSGDVALLIDYENLQISLKRLFNVATPQMSLIIQEAQERGRLVLARAYAPWTSPDLAIDAENLYRQGIEPIYVPSRKNSADVRLAVDAVETAVQAPNLTTFVIVTGDGDLIHPLNFLRQRGRKVIVIGVDAAMSRMLSSAADSVLLYERDLDPTVRVRQPTRTPSLTPDPRTSHDAPAPPSTLTRSASRSRQQTMRFACCARRSNGGEMANRCCSRNSVIGWGRISGSSLARGTGCRLARSWRPHRPLATSITTSGGNSYASFPSQQSTSAPDEEDTIDEAWGSDPGLDVRLESLRPEEQRDLFEELSQLQGSKRGGYLSFRTILALLTAASVLPRLSEGQIRRLLNDLANRNPPILVRPQRRGRTRPDRIRLQLSP